MTAEPQRTLRSHSAAEPQLNSCRIEMPASLRSEGVRVHPGMPFGFASESVFSFAGIPILGTTVTILSRFGCLAAARGLGVWTGTPGAAMLLRPALGNDQSDIVILFTMAELLHFIHD